MSSPNVKQTIEVDTEGHEDNTQDDGNRDDGDQTFDFSDDYRKWKSKTGEILRDLDELRRSLDDRITQVRTAESLQALLENADEVETMGRELKKLRKMLGATEKFVADDFSSSLETLRQSLATYSEVTLRKLNDERKESTEPAGSPTAHDLDSLGLGGGVVRASDL